MDEMEESYAWISSAPAVLQVGGGKALGAKSTETPMKDRYLDHMTVNECEVRAVPHKDG